MKPVNCCVPLCTNNFRNLMNLCFYCIPKDIQLQKKYVTLIRNQSLKLTLDNTRICSAHFDRGKKLSHNHLPSIFSWSKSPTNEELCPGKIKKTKLRKQREKVNEEEMKGH